ncbi:hypothetical protein AC579_10324 [Pseudocercospora musae]|uniref:RING-type domain-containing protein n=1 Tax=Pseudocercospora musae TaxID=113226 RepID=A0A139I9X1_9PEZI|nr:hypothetical protein AC579_10324 [Pseudocercospora musae]KXT11549.1 hypothetical protein AC579_10324 [Pseudocercospora musae]KXT11550.1 hypothetical protein AC579_10324 [Pseudocercospora musae]KXT11551.1 hypothetical protein AC579_10324 [Pseudocercospora musae]
MERGAQPPQMRPAPPASCLVCTGTTSLIRACRKCPGHFCQDCLKNAFDRSLEEPSMFPASCCAILQLHTLLPEYSTDKAKQYRRKFEEWLTVAKVYCPSPTCSAFIPERNIPTYQQPSPAPSLRHLLLQIVDELFQCHHSRFFHGEFSISKTVDFGDCAANVIDLDDVKQNALSGLYDSTAKLTIDMSLIATNARLVMGPWHPISHAAMNLFADYNKLLAQLADRLIQATQSDRLFTQQRIFPCPTCLIAICTKCRQKAHPDQDCDTSALDYEETMLAQYGYKRCPRCRSGIKRMHGCSHVRCHCGAHFCWHCTKSIDDCLGDCGGDFDSDAEDEDMDEDENEEVDGEAAGSMSGDGRNRDDAGKSPCADSLTQGRSPPLSGAHQALRAPVNLDAGGSARWAESDLNFGDEPEEPVVQIWSCHHYFQKFATPKDGQNYGNLGYMECNRCFLHVSETGVHFQREPGAEAGAWECIDCRLIVCEGCKEHYEEKDQ